MKAILKVLLVISLFFSLTAGSDAQVQLGRSLWKDSTGGGRTYFLITNRYFANSFNEWIFPRYFHSSIAGDGLTLGSLNELQLNVDASTGLQIIYDTLRWVGVSTIDVDDSTIYKNLYGKYSVKFRENYGLTKDDGGLKIKIASNSGLTFNPSESHSLTLDIDSGLVIEGNKIRVKLSDEMAFDGNKALEIKSVDASKIDAATLDPTLKFESSKLSVQYDTLTIRRDSVNSYVSAKTRLFLFWADSAGNGSTQARYLTRSFGDSFVDTVGYSFGRGGYVISVVSTCGDGTSYINSNLEPVRFEGGERINVWWDQNLQALYVRINSENATTALPTFLVKPTNTVHLELVLDN